MEKLEEIVVDEARATITLQLTVWALAL